MKYTKLKLLFSLIILIMTGILVSQLTIESNMEDMLPTESQSLAASKDFSLYFDGDDQIYVVVKKSDDSLKDEDYHHEAIEFLEELNNTIKDEPYIDSILFKMSVDEIKPFAWAYIDMEKFNLIDEYLESGNQQGIMTVLEGLSGAIGLEASSYIVNDEETHYMMVIKPDIDVNDFVNSRMTFYDGLQLHLATLLKTYDGIEAGITGGAFIQDLEGDTVAFDGFFSTLVITIILILILVTLFFGSLKLPILTMYPLLLGAMIAAASAFLIYGSLNMFSISFALLLVGLGIDFAVHLIARYQEERLKGLDVDAAIHISVKSTGSSIIMGAITTAFAFATFAIAQFKAFEQMGIISAIGLVALCGMMILLVPVLIHIFDKQFKVKSKRKGLPLLETITAFNLKHPMIVIGVVGCILVVLFANVIKTEIQSDLTAVYPEDIPSARWTDELKEGFDYDPNTISFYADDIEKLGHMTEALETLTSVSEVESISNYLPEDNDEKLRIILRLSEVLTLNGLDTLDKFDLSLMTYEDLPMSIQDNFVGKEGKLRGEIVPSVNIYDKTIYDQLLKDVIGITQRHPVGLPTIMNEVTVLVKDDMILISGLCIVVVLFIAWFAFKKLNLALLTVLPLILTLYMTLGVLPVIGVEINIFSIAAFPLIIGIGIDSAIHLLHRLKEPSQLSIATKVRETGKPIILTGLTTMIGFGSLANINHPGMSNLGITVAIGIALSMVMTLIIIPIGYGKLSQ